MSQEISGGQLRKNKCVTGATSFGQKVPVYDIRNCGPRNQFGANGKIVHNCNWQNLGRGSELRRAIAAPGGWLLAISDLSQIECRTLAWLADQQNVLYAFAQGRDLYCEFGSQLYQREITKADKVERFISKTVVLGAGYGIGWRKFQAYLRAKGTVLDDNECERIIRAYRGYHNHIVAYWAKCDWLLQQIVEGADVDFGLFKLRDKRVYLPNGGWLNYETLFWDAQERGYFRKGRNGLSRYWGGVLTENLTQALARVVMSQAMLRVQALGHRLVMTTHDEGVWLVKDDKNAEAAYQAIEAELKRTPTWAPGLPLDAEGGLSKVYNK